MSWRRQQRGNKAPTRLLIVCISVYAALMAFCGLGLPAIAESIGTPVAPYLWILGPPVNLIHGRHYAWAFGVGTVVVVPLLFGVVRARSSVVKRICVVGLLIAWAVSGACVYAPGA